MKKAACLCAVLLVCVMLAGCLSKPAGGLNADFRASVTSGAVPLTVQFTDISTPGDSPVTAWRWLFGDGAESTAQDPSHEYTAAGSYNVSLEVTTSAGKDTELKAGYITVSAGSSEGEPEGEGQTETVMLSGSVPLEMVWIPDGTFLMGRYAGEQDSNASEDPQHSVTLGGFWMGKYELTKRQWTAVMGTTPWLGLENAGAALDSPATCVSWDDAKEFLTALNLQANKAFRLPSEAQWEYAFRAGTTTRFYWGDDPDYTVGGDYAWWSGNFSQQYSHVVGGKLPNAFGLYDMSGNVWEWCEDDWHNDYTDAQTGGQAWVDSPRGSYRVARGGGWASIGLYCRSAVRYYYGPSYAHGSNGFRLSR
jgi:formylglycine-generating enzyme required for sulfatase activity